MSPRELLTVDNAIQQAAIAEARGLLAEQAASIDAVLVQYDRSGATVALLAARDRASRGLDQRSGDALARTEAEETRLLSGRQAARQHETQRATSVIIVGSAVAGVGLLTLLFGIRREVLTRNEALRVLADQAAVVAAHAQALRVQSAANDKINIALTRSNQDLDQFAYVASHDLKAPLRGIANLATWIEEDLGDAPPGDSREHLRLLRSRVERLDSLIQGILTYARAGRVASEEVTVDAGALLRETIDLIAPPAHVTVAIVSPMPVMVTDRSPLQQCFSNLIGNAIKHGRPDGAVIQVGCEATDEGWAFWVEDNGPGISPEYQGRVFELFSTLAPRDEIEGAGIGLAVVQRLVESRGGAVTVTSAAGAGARFAFTWPVTRPPTAAVATERDVRRRSLALA